MAYKYLLLLLSFVSVQAFSFDGHPYVGGLAGASIGKVGQTYPTITYFSGTTIIDNYPVSNNHASTAIGGLNAGYEFLFGAKWKPAIALGVGVYQTGQFDVRGQVIETDLPDAPSTLYNYKYSLSSTRAMAEVQFTWLLGKFSPFITLGLGPAWVQSGYYQETAVTAGGFVALSPFQSQTHANMAYQAGLGVSCGFNFKNTESEFKHERISLGYRFADLGEASLGTRGSAYPYQLNVGSLKTYDVFLSFTHLF